MAEPALTRRSSRRRIAESAPASSVEATPDNPAEAPAVPAVADDTMLSAAATPLSRRAIRELQRAAAAAAAVPVEDERRDHTVVVETVEVISAGGPVAMPAEPVASDADAAGEGVGATADTAADAHIDDIDADQRDDAAADAQAEADAFEAACRAFRSLAAQESMSDEHVAAAPNLGASLPTEATTAHVAPRRPRVRSKFFALGATVGVMGVAGLIAVSMTLPVEAVAAAQGGQAMAATSLITQTQAPASGSDDEQIQAFVAPADVQNDLIERAENFTTASLIDLAAERGIEFSSALYTNDPDAAIQWPFVVGVGMSSGYGTRNGRLHEGIDLVPGEGAPIQAIADGTVRIATEAGGNYGVTVYIDHVIDGKVVTSHYSHMQYGSLRVVAGQTVEVGDIIGNVGNTGRSYGAHLHFELTVDGTKIDPLPWLQQNAGRYEY